jgi:hypothetical protein
VFVGDLASAPPILGGVAVSVSASPVAGGTAVLTGNVASLRIGGQELWIDNICAHWIGNTSFPSARRWCRLSGWPAHHGGFGCQSLVTVTVRSTQVTEAPPTTT